MPYTYHTLPSGKVAMKNKQTGKILHFKSMAEAKRAARVREYFKQKGGK